ASGPRRAELLHGIQRAGVVDAVDAGLHDDDAVEMQLPLQGHQVLGSSLRRRVDAAAEIGKPRGVEYVDMAIAGTPWHVDVDGRLDGAWSGGVRAFTA